MAQNPDWVNLDEREQHQAEADPAIRRNNGVPSRPGQIPGLRRFRLEPHQGVSAGKVARLEKFQRGTGEFSNKKRIFDRVGDSWQFEVPEKLTEAGCPILGWLQWLHVIDRGLKSRPIGVNCSFGEISFTGLIAIALFHLNEVAQACLDTQWTYR
ncbi:hypothetical protein AJ80_07105 [Polytolypa hystricis UAMH7299]|uniref:Uncharacterized protein n=1 Tax=Polytolypa hystricis (strain UAMH7299) TaxID=1447883 RepID=A0A2B7XSH4_POLH7|nr:hypothetical protein AJ80_07105 [Polytolypa hystricis UAMH7299]